MSSWRRRKGKRNLPTCSVTCSHTPIANSRPAGLPPVAATPTPTCLPPPHHCLYFMPPACHPRNSPGAAVLLPHVTVRALDDRATAAFLAFRRTRGRGCARLVRAAAACQDAGDRASDGRRLLSWAARRPRFAVLLTTCRAYDTCAIPYCNTMRDARARVSCLPPLSSRTPNMQVVGHLIKGRGRRRGRKGKEGPAHPFLFSQTPHYLGTRDTTTCGTTRDASRTLAGRAARRTTCMPSFTILCTFRRIHCRTRVPRAERWTCRSAHHSTFYGRHSPRLPPAFYSMPRQPREL